MQTQIDCKNIIIEKEKERDGVGWRTRGGRDRVGEEQWVDGEEERVREAHETLCLKASCSPSSWRLLFKKIGQRNETPGPFRDQFENPFRSVRDLFVYARNTRRSPLSSQPIRSRYHFTWPGGRERRRSVVPVTRARIHRGEGRRRRRVKFWTRPGPDHLSSSLVVSLVFLLFGAEHRPRRCPMIYTRPEKDS